MNRRKILSSTCCAAGSGLPAPHFFRTSRRAAFQKIFATRFKSLFTHVAAAKTLPRHAWI
ncbi:hypothetical protein BQ8794_210096 [Mesorhizobium prunaredense]|uniref:Uncharacterized protein n=1 Tax=Mesorhizobium prunaredense TaxID=1631249 RepID=A0A1R3V653_9HYPH|nr:hypothetical protein BQ8794_210096 [Mesorhizobium prunaredense]